MKLLFRLGLLLSMVTSSQTCYGQAFVEGIFPPVVQRGQKNRIQVSGTEVEKAVDLWTSVPGVKIQSAVIGEGDGSSVDLDVTVPANAPLGLYGLRLATKSGLSNVHIFLIDELPVTTRTTNNLNKVQQLSLPACVAAPFRPAAIDTYSFNVQSGQRISFEVIGNRFGKKFDPLITIRDPQGRIVVQRDNDIGLFFDCRFSHTFPQAGTYFVEVSDAQFQGDLDSSYVLRMGNFPAALVAFPSSIPTGRNTTLQLPQIPGTTAAVNIATNHPAGVFFREVRTVANAPATWVSLSIDNSLNQFEQAPNNSPDDATHVWGPANFHGVLEKPGEEDWFVFELEKHQRISVQSFANQIGSPADLELVFYSPTNKPTPAHGRESVRVDESTIRNTERNSTFTNEASFNFNPPNHGLYYLKVRDLAAQGGPEYAYRIELRNAEPKLELTSTNTRLTVPRDSFQAVPLKIKRTDFSGPIELSLIGAPTGITLAPTTIPETANEFVCQLRASNSAALGLSTIQIVGRAKKDEQEIEAIAQTHPLIDRQLRNKDRIILALRTNQRRLLPSLTNRIAVMVTPPTPYEIELPMQDLLLPKYQTAEFPIVTKRKPGFNSPINFSAVGGQIGPESELRVQVYGRYPTATADKTSVNGTFFTRNLTGYRKDRVDFTATALHDGYKVNLMRTFMLEVKSAFSPAFEQTSIEMEPGKTTKVKLLANRVKTFDGAITLTNPIPQSGFTYPQTIELPAGQPEFEFDVRSGADLNPGRYQLRFESRGYVGKYQEFHRSPILTITVKKPVVKEPKKK